MSDVSNRSALLKKNLRSEMKGMQKQESSIGVRGK